MLQLNFDYYIEETEINDYQIFYKECLDLSQDYSLDEPARLRYAEYARKFHHLSESLQPQLKFSIVKNSLSNWKIEGF